MRVTDLNDAKALISGILAERKEPFTNVVFLACGGSHACFGIGEYFLRKEAKKVSSSHSKGISTFETETLPDLDGLKKAIHEIGYEVLDQKSEEVTKKKWGLF